MSKELQQPIKETAQGLISTGITYAPIFGDLDVQDLNNRLLSPINKEQGAEAQPTNQRDDAAQSQTISPPVDIVTARKFKDISPHHASCIQSKKYSTLGLGFVSDASEVEDSKQNTGESVGNTESKVQSLLTGEAFIESKVDKILDPLTRFGFMNEFYKTVEDFMDGATGYLEVVRNEQDTISGLNWLPYEDVSVGLIKDKGGRGRLAYRYHGSIFGGSGSIWYSLFGKENRNWVHDALYKGTTTPITSVSEVIPFMVPSNRSKYYGYPDWLSASTIVTLLSMAMQYKSDFYTNKGVLAYILSIAGQIDDPKWREIEALVQGAVGGGNNFKNLAVNVPENSKVQVDKMTSSDATEQQFAKDLEVFAQNIVSAHRVPPVLANILIPGKLGATNEAVQALVSFQLLVIGPYQSMIQKTLARTLGGPDGIEGLDPEDFRLRTITSQFDIQGLDTIGRMKEEAITANRDVSDGLKD